MSENNGPLCDLESGLCAPAGISPSLLPMPRVRQAPKVIYVGDPMCSWCWGIAPAIKELQGWCASEGIPFDVMVGGLRPGGGDQWTDRFRSFLRQHWEEIGHRTGQPFSYRLLEREAFDYDTEPACRAVVAARPMLPGSELDLFAAIQRKFYVENEDPKELDFYIGLCQQAGIDYDAFAERFASLAVKNATLEEFRLNRSWGVTGYPTVLLRHQGALVRLAVGFATFAAMKAHIERVGAASA